MIDHTQLLKAVREVENRHGGSVLTASDDEMQAIWAITGGHKQWVEASPREFKEIRLMADRRAHEKVLDIRATAQRLGHSTSWVRRRERAYRAGELRTTKTRKLIT